MERTKIVDRKEMIEVLEHCMKDDCNGCPKHFSGGNVGCDDYIYGMSAGMPVVVIQNAIDMLKEQDNCENCAVAIEDRQPVVRCRDCKHAVLTTKGEVKYCQFWQEDEDGNFWGDPLYLDSDFFCAGGERR